MIVLEDRWLVLWSLRFWFGWGGAQRFLFGTVSVSQADLRVGVGFFVLPQELPETWCKYNKGFEMI